MVATEKKSKASFGKEPFLNESEDSRKESKIDPKKLILYSEIMKPKFDE